MNRANILFLILLLILLFRFVSSWPLEEARKDPIFDKVSGRFESFRVGLSEKSKMMLPEPQAQLLSGIVLGIKSNLPAEFRRDLADTSTLHIVVASGQNLTLVAGFFLGFVKYIGRKKTIAISLLSISFYSIITGLQAPIIRAGIMVFLASLAKLSNRDSNGSRVLLLTIICMLIFDPTWLISISFQLSALATFGVIVVAPQVAKLLKFMPVLIKQDIAISISAQAMTMPIIALNFYQISLIGVLVNSLVLWTVAPIMISGSLMLLLTFLNPYLAFTVGLIPLTLLSYFVTIINIFSQQWASMAITQTSPILWLGYYSFILGLFLLLKKKTYIRTGSAALNQLRVDTT